MSSPDGRSPLIDLDDETFAESFRYPGGEWQVRLTELGRKILSGIVLSKQQIVIVARIHNSDDILKLALLKNAIDNHVSAIPDFSIDNLEFSLILPYLPYGRADRAFTPGDCFGLQTFGKLVRSMNFTSVSTLDAHSDKALNAVNLAVRGWSNWSPVRFIERAIVDFATRNGRRSITVLFPDAGARSRYKLSTGVTSPSGSIAVDILHCEKKRDSGTGKFTGFTVLQKHEFIHNQPILIVDDICDGGGTFLGIADALKSEGIDFGQESTTPLGLYITHGIFSRGIEVLFKAGFSQLYVTDSFYGPDNEYPPVNGGVTVFDCMKVLNG